MPIYKTVSTIRTRRYIIITQIAAILLLYYCYYYYFNTLFVYVDVFNYACTRRFKLLKIPIVGLITA